MSVSDLLDDLRQKIDQQVLREKKRRAMHESDPHS